MYQDRERARRPAWLSYGRSCPGLLLRWHGNRKDRRHDLKRRTQPDLLQTEAGDRQVRAGAGSALPGTCADDLFAPRAPESKTRSHDI